MKKRKIIKLTEKQLREVEGEAFKYLDASNDTKPYNGQSTITAQGKLNGEEDAEPIFTDRISKQRSPQAWSRYRMYGNINKPPHADQKNILDDYYMSEGVALQGDKDADGIDDTYTNVASMGQGNGVETMSDGDSTNNLCVLPNDVDRKTNMLIDTIKQHNLNPKQIATVLDKFQESFPEIGQNSEYVKSLLRQQIDPNNIKDFD